MVFSSNIFLLSFLPAFLACYYLAPRPARNWVILVGSYIFYAWWRVDFLMLFAGVTFFNYLIGLKLSNSHHRKHWLTLGITGNLGILAYFKYANFGVDSFNTLLTTSGLAPLNMANIVLPIGISFYIFQSISYIVDVYRKDVPPARHFVNFAAFIALFPQLIAGPVLRYKDLAHQFESRSHTWAKFNMGCTWFMIGFIKKVFIADSIAPIVDGTFSASNLDALQAWVGALAYTAQLYFDFSGYSDMAIGIGLMMGFRFINNFDQPYVSQSITEFWRRWHISLSTWLRDYLYIPLGGNRKGAFNTYRNLMITMVLGGFWHGANWTFMLWGAWHGFWLALERYLGLTHKAKPFRFVPWLFTLLIVIVGWVMFRAASVTDALHIYKAMFGLSGASISINALLANTSTTQLFMLLVALITLLTTGIFCKQSKRTKLSLRKLTYYATTPIFFLSVLKLSAQSYSPFLYFQF